ncbi:MAG: hypothetical protein ACOH18_04610 [Candidatus Saccharimonadaceae bacterium]
MSTSRVGTLPSLRAYSIKLTLHSDYPGFSCITIVFTESRQGDLPVPRFSASYVTEEKHKRRPFIIGMPNLLADCDPLNPVPGEIHIPPNGGIVTNHGKQLDVLYAIVGDDNGQSEFLSNAQMNLVKRFEKALDGMISTLDTTYQRSPYAAFVLTER